MKNLKYGLYFFVIAIGLGFSSYIYRYFSSLNNDTGNIVSSQLHGKVSIIKDQYGIPHIKAIKSDEDAIFALGYIHAHDRLWQMEFQRRVVQGRLSEIFGETTLEKDKFLRTWGFYKAAQNAWPAFSQQAKRLIHSYTQGVNAYLQTGQLPIEFHILGFKPQPWTNIDSIAWQKMMAFDLQNSWQQKLQNLQIANQLGTQQIALLNPAYPPNAPTIINSSALHIKQKHAKHATSTAQLATQSHLSYPFDNNAFRFMVTINELRNDLGFKDTSAKGSNNWVVAGRLTKTGKPVLANDPHLSLAAPNTWYLADIQGPQFHAIGATIPGLPGIIIGHNEHIAWGVTNTNPDTQELYLEPKTAKISNTIEVIKIKGKPDQTFPIRWSEHGPIINGNGINNDTEQAIALKWTALLPNDTTGQSILEINYAHNWSDFLQALTHFIVPTQNFIYADRDGNIGYYAPGLIPIRKGWDGSLPIVADQKHEWQGYIPFNMLPHSFNPSVGYIASANNKVDTDNYPFQLTFRWKEPPYRIQRIIDLLSRLNPLTVEGCEEIQTDTTSYLWLDLKDQLLATKPIDKESEQGLKLLRGWDGKTSLDSRAATVFAFWYRELTTLPNKRLPFIQHWNEPLFIKQQLQGHSKFCYADAKGDCSIFLSQSLQHAMSALTTQLGHQETKWNWGNIHKAQFIELGLGHSKLLEWLWDATISTPGGEYTVNYGHYDPATFSHVNGAGYRQIIDLSNFNNSRFIQALGQSGNLFNKHRTDLMLLWRNGSYLPMSSLAKDWGNTSLINLAPADNIKQ